MSGIFGVFQRDGQPIDSSLFAIIRQNMLQWGPDGLAVWGDTCIGLGQARLDSTLEAAYENLPTADMAAGFVFTAAARLDNREELVAIGGWSAADAIFVSDGELLRQAYLRWGSECVNHVYGDWAFAAYHPRERKLFLARDHFGNTSLYYYANTHLFAFASSAEALMELPCVPKKMDELYLAQVMVSWPAYHGERTVCKTIKRLPPAHCLTVLSWQLDLTCYWHLENTPELHLPRSEDYLEAFQAVYEAAVKTRLRRPAGKIKGRGQIAVTLSGGLDSGSVAVTAARLLAQQGERLNAFTSVPLRFSDIQLGAKRLGDEFPYAQATAAQSGNIDLYKVMAANMSPIQGIQHMLNIKNEPAHAAGNFFWILALMQAVKEKECRVLLTGQAGNAGVSWTGDIRSQSVAFQLHYWGMKKWSKEMTKKYLPSAMLKAYYRWKQQPVSWQASPIHPEFARRLDLRERMRKESNLLCSLRTPMDQRCYILKPGRASVGAKWAGNGAAYGLDVRDPTADARVLAFTFSVPDHIFIDPVTGQDRWLIRKAMQGKLPDEVRLNRYRGVQGADLVSRLHTCQGEIEAVLTALAQGPAAGYVDVEYMRQVWCMVQKQNTPEVYQLAGNVLMRGLMAGLFVNGFGK